MYHELKKAQGRISKITNSYVLGKIVEITEKEPSYYEENASSVVAGNTDTKSMRIKTQNEITAYNDEDRQREERVKRILEEERLKRNRTVYHKKSSTNSVNKSSPPPKQAESKAASS